MARRRSALKGETVTEDIKAVMADRPKPKPARVVISCDLRSRALKRAIEEVAQEEGVSRSDVIRYAVTEFLKLYHDGEVDWSKIREPATKNPKVAWRLRLPSVEEVIG